MTLWLRIRLLLAATLLVVAVGRSMWLAFTACAIAHQAAHSGTPMTVAVASRYRHLPLVLEDVRRIGYLEPGGDPWVTPSYLIGRLVILPTIVMPDATREPVVLFDADSEEQLQRWLQAEGVRLLAPFGNGVALVEVQR